MMRLVINIYLLFICFILASCQQENKPRDWDEIQKEGKINIAIDYSSTGFFHQGDSITGIQYEMIKAMSKDLGVKANFKMENDLEESINGLNNGEYDIIARLIPVTKTLKERVLFTDNICKDKQVLVQRKAKTKEEKERFIKNQFDLPGHCISIPKESPYISRLKNLGKEIGDSISIDPIEHYKSEHLIILVAMGDIDYTVCSQKEAKQLSKSYPQLDIKTPISFSQIQAWAVSKQSPILQKKINIWLANNCEKYFQ